MLGRDKVCAVVAAPDARAMRRQLARALVETRIVELRLDWLSSDREILDFLRQLSLNPPKATLIATCRRREAGGQYRGTIAGQLVQLAEAVSAGCAWYDLEIETIRRCPPELVDVLLGEGEANWRLHISSGGMPEESLPQIAAGSLTSTGLMRSKSPSQCDSLVNSRKLLAFASKQRNVVAVPMGDVSLAARLLALRGKSAFGYAPVENATAPGQISLDEMKHVYRADRLDGRTRIYGVIGSPIAHSLSPAMQNAAFAARRMNAVYLPFLVRDLKDFLGLSVEPLWRPRVQRQALPYIERIIRLPRWLRSARCARIGAVNTVEMRGGGKLYGYNTDYVGVLRGLLERRHAVAGEAGCSIVRAGGAARAVGIRASRRRERMCACAARREARAKSLARAV